MSMSSAGVFTKRIWVLALLFALLLTLPAGHALAQGGVLTYGSSVIGTFSATSPVIVYSFQGNPGDQVTVFAVGISPQLTPSISLLSPAQQPLGANARDPFGSPAGGAARVSSRLREAGIYTVIVSSPTGLAGDFLLRLDGSLSSASTNLALNVPAAVNIPPGAAPVTYSFNGDPLAPQTLTLATQSLNFAFSAQVYDGNGQLVAVMAGPSLRGTSLTVLGEGLYQVVLAGLTPEMQGTIDLALTSGGAVVAAGQPPAAIPTTAPAVSAAGSGCTLSNPSGGNVNIRSGPGTNYPPIGSLNVGASIPGVGRDSSGSWFVVNIGGRQGWIGASVVTATGSCQTLPVVAAPPAPSISSTVAPTIALPTTAPGQPTATLRPPPTTAPGQPTATATSIPPTATATLPGPTATLIPSATSVPPTQALTLNLSGPPTFGSTNLAAGFLPDPFAVSITSGGPVDASFLGGPCRGFAAVNPDFQLFWSGASARMTIGFVGSGDTTLIINTPSGGWICDDDSGGFPNPLIAFTPPQEGRYDIWVGSFASGEFVSGTLNISELN